MNILSLRRLVSLAAFIFIAADQQAIASRTPEEIDKALNAVAQATTSSWGMVGTPANLSETEVSARRLYQKATSREVFDGLKRATNEGKLYLICVLAKKDKHLFSRAIKETGEIQSSEVSVFSGNVLQKVPMKIIVVQMQRHGCDSLNQ